MEEAKHLKVLESSNVSPPPGSVPSASLCPTFFDLLWFSSSNVQRLFFYEFPYPTSHFMETVLPLLKHSLSLTLHRFFPFAANIMCPPPPGKPYIRYKDGDSVTFTVVESPADFHRVIANYPRDVRLLHPLAPRQPTAPSVEEDGTRVIPAVAFRVTVFPNAGVCIGSNYCHVIGDGKTFMHFMRTWTNVYKAGGGGGELTCLEKLSLPLLNRDVIKDPIGVESFLLEVYHNWLSSSSENTLPTDVGSTVTKVRATFVLCGETQGNGQITVHE